ncbi:alkaline phosphatase family protein [Lysinibacillus pakistanensis]|uniref:Alkaline phosphatase family protein n=1 Tax=Lysinibacillus pakistanensis TaxID=759811 RepID=A0AAX3X0V8_9BACI|nr:alkaline phosphatase family protein [Lysinibacillus pakistanensis]MDM5231827.1 alkaline phosphatase family protein [Lysinibacillus pakistanensis]WHY47366.1 alkaline phosphatase family protein [Lysinibacillus pakistanensis]WHY52375.1 alkaline phosphatase family protein [Lysinibacillus pakistanensis]
MKLLVIGIDALMPELVYNNLDLCPNIARLIETGTSGAYSGYIYGHGSRDNWISMYTGLEPEVHGTVLNRFKETNRMPRSTDYNDENTIWNILSKHHYKVGFWKGLSTTPPQSVNGYIVAGEPHYENEGYDAEIVSRKPILIDDKQYLLQFIKGEEPIHPEPKTLKDFGYTFEELKGNPQLIDNLLEPSYFEEALDFFEKNLDFRLQNMISVQKKEPVDLMWMYDAVFDYIAHFQMFDTGHQVLKKALSILDKFIGKLIGELNPKNILLLSDHGQKSYREIFPNLSNEIVEEAFGLAKQCIITEKNIVLIGRMEGLLSGLHSLNGIVCFSGEAFAHAKLQNFRTIDIYSMILELFNIELPSNRKGYIQNIFSKEHSIKNKAKIIPNCPKQPVLLIQSEEVSEFNRAINEFYKQNRFKSIYVYGEKKYKEVFLANDQVDGFYLNEVNLSDIDCHEIYAVYHNRVTKNIQFIRVR